MDSDNLSEVVLVVGLGNIGSEYENSRHNAGFAVIDRVAEILKVERFDSTDLYYLAEKKQNDSRIILSKPKTLMNRSGLAVVELLEKFSLEPTEILVVTDDFNLPLGTIRFRENGSAGGHNGLGSIIETLATENFPRLRLGIGPLPDNIDTVDFVLGHFSDNEINSSEKMFDFAAEAVIFALENRFSEVMTKYNIKPA